MFKKICCFAMVLMMTLSSLVFAEIEYDIHDIGTLQAKASQAIALNNKGQILAWYNVDGSASGKHFFVRNRNGDFHELPEKEPSSGLSIDWRYLTDEGKAYGTFDPNSDTRAICLWDQQNGIVKLGVLPGRDVVAINNAGQVLIRSVSEIENGKSCQRPVIWQNGQITKLKGLSGDLGIESEESYGYDMNNKGEVVGQSLVSLSYKNEIFKQVHAVKWVDGQAIDLHNKVPRRSSSCAQAINDLGDVVINNHLIRVDGKIILNNDYMNSTPTNTVYFYKRDGHILDRDGNNEHVCSFISSRLQKDFDFIWMNCEKIIGVNDSGEIIAQAKTIYGEEHAMLLCPATTH